MLKLLPLILGLVVFIGSHIVTRMNGVRAGLVEKLGEGLYRALYSLVAIGGLSLIAYGFGSYRASGMIPVWDSPRWMAHLVVLMMWASFVLLAAAFLPGRIKARAKQPMLAAVKIWAFAHLLANGDLGSILLFGSFLVWAVLARIAVKRAAGAEIVPGAGLVAPSAKNDLWAIILGSIATAIMVLWLHKILIGVAVIGV